MKRVFLLRHAKAAPAEHGQDDKDRPLLPRGVDDAGRMARFLKARGYRPDHLLVSAAARTVQTAELALPSQRAALSDRLYLAPAIRILGMIHSAPPKAASVMVVGHNPGMEELAELLARDAPGKAAWEEKFPTCALAVLDFRISRWTDVAASHGAVVEFVSPRDF